MKKQPRKIFGLRGWLRTLVAVVLAIVLAERQTSSAAAASGEVRVLEGRRAFTDAADDRPGTWHRVNLADLQRPFATGSVSNRPAIVPRPAGVKPIAPEGFEVALFAEGLRVPRGIAVAPNGDIFVTESLPGTIRVFRGVARDGRAMKEAVFATGLNMPYGLAFYPPRGEPQFLYVGETDKVVRIPYRNGDLKARGEGQIVARLPAAGMHWTRAVAFSPDGRKMFVAVGSDSNIGEGSDERERADILVFDPEGGGRKVYASGLRNPSGLAIHPGTGELWTVVNERDRMGDDLPPDYATHVTPGGFYGWPWYYIGPHRDPRVPSPPAGLRDKVLVPDVLLQAHCAPLWISFYEGTQFPARFRHQAFVAMHGSWNRGHLSGYKVVMVEFRNNRPTGRFEDFLTGFVMPEESVWGRPVAVEPDRAGGLIVSDDSSGSLWRIVYSGTGYRKNRGGRPR